MIIRGFDFKMRAEALWKWRIYFAVIQGILFLVYPTTMVIQETGGFSCYGGLFYDVSGHSTCFGFSLLQFFQESIEYPLFILITLMLFAPMLLTIWSNLKIKRSIIQKQLISPKLKRVTKFSALASFVFAIIALGYMIELFFSVSGSPGSQYKVLYSFGLIALPFAFSQAYISFETPKFKALDFRGEEKEFNSKRLQQLIIFGILFVTSNIFYYFAFSGRFWLLPLIFVLAMVLGYIFNHYLQAFLGVLITSFTGMAIYGVIFATTISFSFAFSGEMFGVAVIAAFLGVFIRKKRTGKRGGEIASKPIPEIIKDKKQQSSPKLLTQPKLSDAKRAEEERVKLDKLREIVDVAVELPVSRLAKLLEMDEDECWKRVIGWAKTFGFKINNDKLVFGTGLKEDFLASLDKEFAIWGKTEKKS